MMRSIFKASWLIVLFAALTLTACNSGDKKEGESGETGETSGTTNDNKPKSIADIATGDEQFSTLVAALTKADLVSTLAGEGNFTVFAPTNDAFTALLGELGLASLDDLSPEALKPILLYHVLGSVAKSTDLSKGYVPTLDNMGPNQTQIKLLVDPTSGVKLNGAATVTGADVEASNGVVHVIDKVLLPPTVVDHAINNSDFSILVEAVAKAELVDALKAEGPFTVFAPTNAAFEALFAELGVTGIADLDKETLTPILLYHVVNGNVLSTDVSSGSIPTLNENAQLEITVEGGSVTLSGGSKVVATDVQGTNGVIHVIDKVLVPANPS